MLLTGSPARLRHARSSPATLALATGAAAALVAAAERPDMVSAIVSRSGRLDLAGAALGKVLVPTPLLVRGFDVPVLEVNKKALPVPQRSEAAGDCPRSQASL